MTTGNENLIKYLEQINFVLSGQTKDKPYIISAPSSKKQQLLDKQVADYSKSCCIGITVED